MTILLLGLILGMRHAMDPDHVLAIGTIVSRDPRLGRAVGTGAFWGLGHTLTVLVVGTLMLLGGVTVPARAVLFMELAVALMLVVLGVMSFRPLPATSPASPPIAEGFLVSRLRPLIVGMIHGLAGSAALTLLALTTIPGRAGALAYLGLFGVGTVAGMMLITLAIALPLSLAGRRSSRAPRWIARASGALSVLAGLAFAVQTLSAHSRP